jgi:hypothetical protein
LTISLCKALYIGVIGRVFGDVGATEYDIFQVSEFTDGIKAIYSRPEIDSTQRVIDLDKI